MPGHARATAALAALAVLMSALLPAFVGLHLVTPSDGARIPAAMSHGDRVGLTPLDSPVLQPGDTLIAIDGRSIDSIAAALTDWAQPAPQWAAGQTVRYTLIRNGQQLVLPVTLGPYPMGVVLARDWGAFLSPLIISMVFGFVFVKRPAEPIARTMLAAAAGMVASTTWSVGLTVGDLVNRAGFWLFAISSTGAYMLVWVGALHSLLLFPSPWPPLTRQRWIGPALYALPYAAFALVSLSLPGRNALAWHQAMGQTTSVLQALYMLATFPAVVRSYRAARDPVSRAQVRWVATAFLVVFFCALTFAVIPELILGYPILSWSTLALIGLLIPLAFAFAILRYRLFDIDLILNRTLVYGALSLIVVGLYVGVVGSLTALLGLQNNLLVSLVITALVAVIFQPLRQRLQRAVNRFMYGDRDEPYAVLARLGQRLESTLAPNSILPGIVETVAQTLKLPYAAITLRDAGADRVAATYGLPPADSLALPLIYQHELIGHLRVGARAHDEPFSPAEMRLLEDIARQAGMAAHNVRLAADLQKSRERLVAAREEERRRIRRDLHDGLGPTLASHAYRLDAALDLIEADPDAARTLITDLKTQTQATLADIRRLVYELRPPALDELGLVAALRAQYADSVNGLRISIDSTPAPMPPLSAAVEAAAYRIAGEAINNAVRHARARNCVVHVTAARGGLEIDVRDDGRGIPPQVHAGVGISSMRERAAELGGALVIEPLSGGGTRILARLPLAESGSNANDG